MNKKDGEEGRGAIGHMATPTRHKYEWERGCIHQINLPGIGPKTPKVWQKAKAHRRIEKLYVYQDCMMTKGGLAKKCGIAVRTPCCTLSHSWQIRTCPCTERNEMKVDAAIQEYN